MTGVGYEDSLRGDSALPGEDRMEALILEITTRGLHRYFPIERETTTIGRALDNDIILSDPTVAPHHLQLVRLEDGSIEVVNLTDVNPTRVDRQPVDRSKVGELPVPLEIGRIGCAKLLPRKLAEVALRALSPVWTVVICSATPSGPCTADNAPACSRAGSSSITAPTPITSGQTWPSTYYAKPYCRSAYWCWRWPCSNGCWSIAGKSNKWLLRYAWFTWPMYC